MIIGSHVSMSAPDYLLQAFREANSYQANACMIYTGAPQNTRRTAVEKLKVEEAIAYGSEHELPIEHVIVHAPYIINLANTIKPETFDLAVDFLRQELVRVQLRVRMLVLHPGSHVKDGEEAGLAQIVKGLDLAMEGMGTRSPSHWRRWPERAASWAGIALNSCAYHRSCPHGNDSASAWTPVICTTPDMMSRISMGCWQSLTVSSAFSESRPSM